MSKTKKILIALLTVISALCLTLAGCTKNSIEFQDFENKTIEYELNEIFGVSQYLDVLDKDGNPYIATCEVFDADGNKVEIKSGGQFTVVKNYYRLVITVKDDDEEILGQREIIINGVNKTPPYIMFLNMPDFGVINNEVKVPLEFNAKGAQISKKLVVERYLTKKVNGEYVTTTDTENAIVVNGQNFTDDVASFTPTKPGVYKISVYAWNNHQTEADARVLSKDYSIKETADAWGEIESFETPASLIANYNAVKTSPIGEDWYQELPDKNGVVKYGVIKGLAADSTSTTRSIYIQSTYRNNSFFKNWLSNSDFDYLSMMVLVKPKDANEEQKTVSVYKASAFNTTKIPVGEWFEYKVSKTELKVSTNVNNVLAYARATTNGTYFTVSSADYEKFDFYFDNVAYAKGADIVLDKDTYVMGSEITFDIANAGELTKDDFTFYVNKTNAITNNGTLIEEGFLKSGSYSFRLVPDGDNPATYTLLDGNTYTTEIEDDYVSRTYFVQAKLNEQGLQKTGGEQIFASKLITVNGLAISLGESSLGQEVTIDASLEGVDGLTYTYAVKKSSDSDSDWTTLTNNKFTPTVSTSYDVKVVATLGDLEIEKIITKDYAKNIVIDAQFPTGFNKYVIDHNINIVAELEGAENIVVTVKDEHNSPVTITNNAINVSATGTYVITATATYNGIQITNQIEIVVVGDIIIEPTFKVDGEDFDVNNPIMLNSQVTIEALVGGQLPANTANIEYYVVRLDSNPANNYEFTLNNGTFKASLAGTYNVFVYYTEDGIINSSDLITFEVVANTIENARVINTFSDSASVAAAYLSSAKNEMVEGTTWYNEYEGEYGVISTVGQTYNTNYSAFYLRSADYDTQTQMENAGLAKTLFGTEKAPSDEGYLVGFNCENWDYLSIKVYFAKPNGAQSNTLNVYYGDHSDKGDILTVNYNEWTELKIDKGMLLNKLCNSGRLLQQYSTANDDAHRKPMFYADSANVGTVYFDSMSFEKYAEYKHFAEFYYEDNGTQVPKEEIYKIDVNRVNVPLQIKIKLEENDSGYLTIPLVKSGASIDGTSANIVVDYYEGYSSNIKRELQDADNKKINYYAKHMLYFDRSDFNVPCQLIVSNNTKDGAGTVHLKYIYTHTDGTKYVGYLATKIMFTDLA